MNMPFFTLLILAKKKEDYQTQLKYLQRIRQLAVAGMHIPSYIVWCFNY